MVLNGNIIRNIRKSKGMSQVEAADFLGISQTAYSKLENNITKLSAERISLLSLLFKVEESSFFKSPKNINLENNSLQFENISNLLKSQKDIFDEQKKLMQETINILKAQVEQCNKQIDSLLRKLED